MQQTALANQEEELFFVAQKAFEDGFYEITIRYINQFLEKYPETEKRAQAKLLLGQCYFFKSQYLQAYDIFNDLVGNPELQDAVYFWLGETYLKGADYKQARNNYHKLLEDYPDSFYVPQAYYSLGWSFFEESEYESAKTYFSHLIKEFSSHELVEDSIFKLAECDYNLNEYDKAIHSFKDYIVQYPHAKKTIDAYFYIAESYYYLENYLAASTNYTKVVSIAKDKKMKLASQISLAWSYLKLKRFELALSAFEEAKGLSEKNNILSDDIYFGLANLYAEKGENDKALREYSFLITTFPNSPRIGEARIGKANIFYLNKDYEAAIKEYENILQDFSQKDAPQEIVEKATFGLAWTYLKAGYVGQSIKTFRKIFENATNDIVKISALTQIGDAYHNIEKLDDALEIYDQILRDYPNSIYADYAQFKQGITLLKLEKTDAAALSFQSLQANFPQSEYIPDSKYYLAVTYFKKEDWKTAIELVRDYIASAGQNNQFASESHYILALSLYNIHKPKEALDVFQKVINDYPEQEAIVINAQFGMAKCLFDLERVEEAIKKFNQIALQYPKSEIAQDSILWLGDYYYGQSVFENAKDYYLQLIQNFPNSGKINIARYNLARTYEAQQGYDKALFYYSQIGDPRQGEIYAKAKLAIADIFAKKFDYKTAFETYQNIIANVPDYKRNAYVKMADVYRDKKVFDKAVDSYQNALSSSIGLSQYADAELQFRIADTYELSNDAEKAQEEYLKIPYLYPKATYWIVKAYLRTARIFEDAERWDEAITIYKKTIALKTEEAKFAQERIEWIQNNSSPINQ